MNTMLLTLFVIVVLVKACDAAKWALQRNEQRLIEQQQRNNPYPMTEDELDNYWVQEMEFLTQHPQYIHCTPSEYATCTEEL